MISIERIEFCIRSFCSSFFGTWPGNELQPGLVTRGFFSSYLGVHIDNYGHHSPKFTPSSSSSSSSHPPSPPMITKITIFFFLGGGQNRWYYEFFLIA